MNKEKIKLLKVGYGGVFFDVEAPSWREPTAAELFENFTLLLHTHEAVILPLANFKKMFSHPCKLEAFLKKFDFKMRFDNFQQSFVCEMENPIGEDRDE